jgi:tetratricopeptide (TPR) repeat protein
MKAFVFTDQALTSEAGRFVWLEIDTEKAKNAAIRKRLNIAALPTFFIVDPADEKIVMRVIGGMNITQLQKMLADGKALTGGGALAGGSPADAALAKAERLNGEGDDAAAAPAYLEAVKLAPADWPSYGRAVESAMWSLSQIDSNAAAVALAKDALPRLPRGISFANVAASGLGSALALPDETPGRAGDVALFEKQVRAVLDDPALPLAGDDRSGLYISLLDARQDAKDSVGAHQVAGEWSRFLDGEAAKAKTPQERMVYDPHRLSAYIEIGHPEKAIPMLEQSQKDAPNDYNPPARLALAYKAMKKWPEAIAASDRALSMVYGPRTLTVLNARTDIHLGMQDTLGARKTVEKAIATVEGLPPEQRNERTIASLKKRLASLSPPTQ